MTGSPDVVQAIGKVAMTICVLVGVVIYFGVLIRLDLKRLADRKEEREK